MIDTDRAAEAGPLAAGARAMPLAVPLPRPAPDEQRTPTARRPDEERPRRRPALSPSRAADFKTGAAPRVLFEARALFQLKFYALVLLRSRGVLPRQLRLMYLGDGESLSLRPGREELDRFERTLVALWRAVQRAAPTGDFRP